MPNLVASRRPPRGRRVDGRSPTRLLCELLANTDQRAPSERRCAGSGRFIDEPLPPLTEVALAASALAELRHGSRKVGVEALKRLLRHG
jgi:hypothetical protein